MAADDAPANPWSFALNLQRDLLESSVDAVEKAEVAQERIERMQEVETGKTPSEVVYEENKLELLHYEPQTDEQHDVPIIVVYALINRPSILDLQPDRSVVRRLLEAGHDVYLIDWNEPSRLDQHLTLEDYVNRYVDNCVDVVRERSGQDAVNVLGYCMGGTMSVMYAALHQEKVRTLGLMAAGLCFDDTGGVLELWGDEQYYDPEEVTDAFGNMPAEWLDVGFALMDPVANYVSKYVRLYDNLENEDFVENFARMEQWLSEGIDVAGDTYVQFLEDIYQDNKLHRNEFHLGGEHVDVTSIDVPVLQILGEYDHLVPSESSKPFNDVVGSDDVTTIEYPTGHIGLAVSGSSHRDVWPQVAEWYLEKSGEPEAEVAAEAAAADAEAEEVGPAGAEGSDLEEVDGIGPTYAERLRDAGFATLVDLADADAAQVAEAADVGEERAAEWLAEARELAEEGVESLDGIGPTYADRLRGAGLGTVEALAGADVETVAETADVGEDRARTWIQQAGGKVSGQ